MNNDKVEGHGKDLSGKVKEAAGDATNDRKLEREGQSDQAEGKVQKAVGKVKDAFRK